MKRDKISYTPQRITVLQHMNDHSVEFSIFAIVASNGLAYYRWLNENGKKGRYMVFHVVSGKLVFPSMVSIYTPQKCKHLIALLDPLTDWHQSEEMVLKGVRFTAFHSVLLQAEQKSEGLR